MTKLPPSRYPFLGVGDELHYLNDLIEYFRQHQKLKSSEAELAMMRFEELLQQSGTDNGSIVLQEHWALLFEVKGDFRQAVKHRKREAELVIDLFSIGGPVGTVNPEFLDRVIKKLIDDATGGVGCVDPEG
jgi:K+-sensing histidine kinase KdpD